MQYRCSIETLYLTTFQRLMAFEYCSVKDKTTQIRRNVANIINHHIFLQQIHPSIHSSF